jgi:hypothetical protein
MNSNFSITFPSHCDVKRVYSFKLMAQTDGLSYISSQVTTISTNNISLSKDFAYPITVEIVEENSYAYDLREYFVHSNPNCHVDRFQIFQIFDPDTG